VFAEDEDRDRCAEQKAEKRLQPGVMRAMTNSIPFHQASVRSLDD